MSIWERSDSSSRPFSFSLLTVCEGNICRSPLAAQLLQALSTDPHITISSAGTNAMIGSRMDSTAAALSRNFGGEPDNHSARQISKAIVETSDMIITMTRRQRDEVVQLAPASMKRTFTLLELEAVAMSTTTQFSLQSQRLRNIAANAYSARGSTRYFDVEDPFKKPASIHEEVAHVIHNACRALMKQS